MPPDRKQRDGAGESPASSGIEGLDHMLGGGFPRGGMHLVQGETGTGKTTMALQFLLAGVAAGEKGLYLTASQTGDRLERIARSHNWSLDGITIHELPPAGLADDTSLEEQTVLHSADVELDELTGELRRIVEAETPRRVVLDSVAAIRMLAADTARYQREIVRLLHALSSRDCTAMFLAFEGEPELHSLSSSTIGLEQEAPAYGDARRLIRVIKVQGVPFHGGYHNFKIETGGLKVFSRLPTKAENGYDEFELVSSGVEVLDSLLGGGLEFGTTCLIVGHPGSGKSTLASLYARGAAASGKSAALFIFDERREAFVARAAGLGVDLEPHMEAGLVSLSQLDPATITPGEFAQLVKDAVDKQNARVVVIDSLTGYFNSMADGTMLSVQMHELLQFLGMRGVLAILIVAQQGFMTIGQGASTDVSYLSDTIIVTRMFESRGYVRRCMAAVKKRQGEHDTTIRELLFRPGHVDVAAEPLRGLDNILGGPHVTHNDEAAPERGDRME